MKKSRNQSILIILFLLAQVATAQVPTDGLVISLPFNGSANDESGNGFNGIVHGATLTSDRCNNENSAYLFDGYGDFIELPISMAINTDNSFSIVAWINNYTITSDGRYADNAIFGQTDGPIGTDFPIIAFEVKIDNTIRVLVRGSNNPPVDFRTIETIQDNSWNQIAMVSDSQQDSMAIFINGKLIRKVKADLAGNTITNDWVSIGAYYDDLLSIFHFFSGKIDDVLIYNRALTDKEIKNLYFHDCHELSLNGESTVCQGDENVIFNSISNEVLTNYVWTYSGTGASIFGDSDTVSITFSESATSGTLSVAAVSVGMDILTSEFPIVVNPLPEAAGIITGEKEVCISQGSQIYSIPQIPNATSYEWHYSGTEVSISGTSNQISMIFNPNAIMGHLTVSGKNSCGSGNTSPAYEIIPISPPASAGAITGLNEVCQNTGDVTFSTQEINNATSYIWNYSGTEVSLQGNSENVSLYFFNNATSGNLTVFGTNQCGPGASSENFPIIVKSCSENPGSLSIPNAFSPNGDGINDLFLIKGLPSLSQLLVFDRSGKKCYQSDNYLNDWDGKDSEGYVMQSDTYWYILIVPGIQNEFKGFVYLKK